MTRRLAWAAIVLLATYLTFVGGGWLGIYTASLRIASVAAAGAGLACWISLWPRHPEWRPRSVLLPAIAAALASLAISSVFSRVPRMSLEYLGYAVVLAALYLLLVRLMAHSFFARRLLRIGGMFFIVVCASFLSLVGSHWVDWWRALGHLAIPPLRPSSEGLTFGNPSAVLTMATLLAVPTVALIDPSTRRGKAAIAVVVLVLGLVALLTGSRAGWLAITLTMVIGAVAGAINPNVRYAVRRAVDAARLGRAAKATLGLLLVIGVAALAALGPAILRRVTESGTEARTQYVVTALRMFGESPIVGTGPGTWVIQRPAATVAGEIDFYIPHAHDVPAQMLAELGLIGAAAAVVLVVLLGRLVFQAIGDTDPLRRRMGWATLLGLAYFALHQLLDFYANMPAALFAAALPVAFLDATSPAQAATQPASPPGAAARAVRVAGVAVLAVALVGLVLQELPALQAERAVRQANSGNWASADADARAASQADPDIGSYVLTAGLTAARAGDDAAAAAFFERVARRDDLPEAWLNLAAEQLALGDTGSALQSLKSALRLGRQRPAVALGIADVATQTGDEALAADAAASAILAYPTLAADPWWAENPERAAVLGAAVTHIISAGGVNAHWQVSLMTGALAEARQVAASSPDPAFNLLVINGWSGNTDAYRQLLAACGASPLNAVWLTWCARVAGHLGNLDQAARMRTLESQGAGFTNGSGAPRIVAAPGPTQVLDGQLAAFWGTFTYRRPTPVDMLVPSIAHITLE